MPLVKATIKSEVKEAFTAVMNQQGDDREGALDKVADKLADARSALTGYFKRYLN